MEVHQHTHTPRKKWTHYFWEFLMLFLAVFCGFLAEYQLEHIIERDREKQFIATLVEDLKSDTAQLTETILYKRSREKMCDSLITYLAKTDYKKYGNDIYYNHAISPALQYFFPNDRTLQQLKNSGALRLIRKLSVLDSIMFYDQQLRYLSVLNEDERGFRENFRETIGSVFDGKVLYSQFDSIDIRNYRRPEGNPSLLLQEAISINNVISSTQYLKSVLRGVKSQTGINEKCCDQASIISAKRVWYKIILWKFIIIHILARKKWTHYFWEFLMLFLAVFCGFLAENQREHYIEHHREKQYMRSMLKILQTDTAT